MVRRMFEAWASGDLSAGAVALSEHLHVDWRRGERWYRRHLVDGDLSSNAGSWQWVAGTGLDAAPYFRILNPLLQQERFDLEGAYVERWAPDRPPPMLDLAAERARALELYGAARRRAGRSTSRAASRGSPTRPSACSARRPRSQSRAGASSATRSMRTASTRCSPVSARSWASAGCSIATAATPRRWRPVTPRRSSSRARSPRRQHSPGSNRACSTARGAGTRPLSGCRRVGCSSCRRRSARSRSSCPGQEIGSASTCSRGSGRRASHSRASTRKRSPSATARR